MKVRAFDLAMFALNTLGACIGAGGQSGDGWVNLFDGKTIGEHWDRVGESN